LPEHLLSRMEYCSRNNLLSLIFFLFLHREFAFRDYNDLKKTE